MNDVDEHPVLWMHLCGFGCYRSNYVVVIEAIMWLLKKGMFCTMMSE